MSKKQRSESHKPPWPQVAVVAGLVILIGGVLIAKQTQSAALPTVTAPSPTRVASLPPGLPEQQLDQLLAEKRPTLAFFHSNSCQQCIQMTEIVKQVYPEFASSVALVDVNVYDDRNARLLQRSRISVIPTLVFFNRMGQRQVATGVMQPAQLRQALQALGGS